MAVVWDEAAGCFTSAEVPNGDRLIAAVYAAFSQPEEGQLEDVHGEGSPAGVEQSPAFSELEGLLSDDPEILAAQGVLVVQAANEVLADEGAQLAELLAEQGKPLVCRAGCAGCCHQLVLSEPFEDSGIVAWLQAHPEALEHFRAAYPLWREKTSPFLASYLAWARRLYAENQDDGTHTVADYHVPCPFLDAQACCVIYPVRPYPCRTSVAVDSTCPAPEGGLPGSRNMQFASFTPHHGVRKAVMRRLLQRMSTSPVQKPLAERLWELVGQNS